MPDSGGYAIQPVAANSPNASDTIIRPAAPANNQKLSEFNNGNATSRAPI